MTLRATDLDASARFYDIVLRTLGAERVTTRGLARYDQFSLSPANVDKPATRGPHIEVVFHDRRTSTAAG